MRSGFAAVLRLSLTRIKVDDRKDDGLSKLPENSLQSWLALRARWATKITPWVTRKTETPSPWPSPGG